MSRRPIVFAYLVLVAAAGGCGSNRGTVAAGEPQTARDKQYADAQKAGDVDGPNSKWGKWRYTGNRKECFYVAGRKCFKTEVAACQANKCRPGTKCKSSGAGPATITCGK
jgi:hypothetical protein